MSVIPALEKLKQKDHKFEASIGCIVRPFLSNQRKNKNKPKNKAKCDKLNQPTLFPCECLNP
jgi:hypothetical protein